MCWIRKVNTVTSTTKSCVNQVFFVAWPYLRLSDSDWSQLVTFLDPF